MAFKIIDTEKTYAALGKFIVLFQHLENTIVQIIRLIEQPEADYDIRSDLAEVRFTDLLKRMHKCILKYAKNLGLTNYEQFEREINELYTKCINLTKRRNDLVHSTYVHVEASGELHSIVRVKAKKLRRPNKKNNHEFLFIYEEAKTATFDQSMSELLSLIFSFGLLHNQLIHWKDSKAEPKRAGRLFVENLYKST